MAGAVASGLMSWALASEAVQPRVGGACATARAAARRNGGLFQRVWPHPPQAGLSGSRDCPTGPSPRLFVTERTVEAHTKQIFLKLGLDTDPDSRRRVLAVLAYLRSPA